MKQFFQSLITSCSFMSFLGCKLTLVLVACRLTCMQWMRCPNGRTLTVFGWCCWSCDGSWHARKTWSFLSHPKARSTPTELLLLMTLTFSLLLHSAFIPLLPSHPHQRTHGTHSIRLKKYKSRHIETYTHTHICIQTHLWKSFQALAPSPFFCHWTSVLTWLVSSRQRWSFEYCTSY